MKRRLFALHLQARGGPPAVVGLIILATLAWAASQWLVTRPSFDGPAARVPVVALAPLLGALLLGSTLAGADDQLERSTPSRWPLWRAAHVALATAAVCAALCVTGLRSPEIYGAYALIRGTVGCIGLVAGAAVLLGARLAWLPALVYVGAVLVAAPPRDGGIGQIWAWPLEPSTAYPTWWTAVALFVAGCGAYVACGARPASP